MLSLKTTTVRPAVGARRSVVPQASSERRAILGSLVAGVVSLASGAANAADVTPVDLFDDRKVKKTGFEIIYEARDLDLTQSERDGITQFRGDLTATKKRFVESSRRIKEVVGPYVDKSYWTIGKEELRLQVGNFRQDMQTIASSKATKADRKAGLAKAKELLVACENLDYAMTKKDLAKAQAEYANVKSKLAEFQSYAVA